MIKRIPIFLLLLIPVFIYTQENLRRKIYNLKNKIEKFEGLEKLKLLDSLTNLVLDKPQY